MKNMDIEQTDNKILDLCIFLVTSLVASELWKELFNGSIHAFLVCITVLLSSLLGYMAKNFWLPYYFPKDGKWKYFNFLRPRK